jgi:hypothetical protein
MKQEKLHGLYWVMNGGGWLTEIQLDTWDKRNYVLYFLVKCGIW